MALKFPLVASSLAPGEALAPSLIFVLLTNRIELLGFVVILLLIEIGHQTRSRLRPALPSSELVAWWNMS